MVPGVIGPTWAMREKRRAVQGRLRAPSPSSPNRTRRGAVPPFSFSPSLWPASPPPSNLYIRGQGGTP